MGSHFREENKFKINCSGIYLDLRGRKLTNQKFYDMYPIIRSPTLRGIFKKKIILLLVQKEFLGTILYHRHNFYIHFFINSQ
jgi:hypothetical protein